MTDWAEWSREAVRLMQARNAEWMSRYGVTTRTSYRWDLQSATISLARERDDVVSTLTCVGTASASAGTFLWAWANPAIPDAARAGLNRVRAFGIENALSLLTEPEVAGGKPEGLELAAVAGRITDASGVFVDAGDDTTCFFLLRDFRIVQRA